MSVRSLAAAGFVLRLPEGDKCLVFSVSGRCCCSSLFNSIMQYVIALWTQIILTAAWPGEVKLL